MANAIVHFIRCHRHFTRNRRAPFQESIFIIIIGCYFFAVRHINGTLVYTYCTGKHAHMTKDLHTY